MWLIAAKITTKARFISPKGTDGDMVCEQTCGYIVNMWPTSKDDKLYS